jgi:DNA (cytosine-5)-methyltransferase 1
MREPTPTPPARSMVSLFAGAGGLDAGLEQAGFTTVLALDNDPDATATLQATKDARLPIGDGRTYLEQARIETADITELTKAQIVELWGFPNHRPTVLAGGPPCQPFSSAGRMKGIDDARGRLFLDFVRAARALRPDFVVFENVQGLVTARDTAGHVGGVLMLVQETFERAGYACRFDLVNAADYGAPQRRVRLVMLAARRHEPPALAQATHDRGGGAENLLFPWVTMREALSDLPEPREDEVVRPRGDLQQKLAEVTPGQGIRVLGMVEANRPSGHWGYRQDGFVADPDQPARTIRAASTPDWLRLPDGSHRRLTWRECARLQGFPDDWSFQGKTTSRFRQVGNAVPLHLSRALGDAVIRAIESGELPRREKAKSAPWPASFKRRIRYTTSEHRINGELRLERTRAHPSSA